ncbi:MAG: hypothetical protein WA002_08325 [Candidatus Acidiferrales bacterium]
MAKWAKWAEWARSADWSNATASILRPVGIVTRPLDFVVGFVFVVFFIFEPASTALITLARDFGKWQ